MKKIRNILENNLIYIVFGFLILISLVSFLYYFELGINTNYADSISRLNIARKVIDNITPGFPQVGNVWLPLPQILMIPFIWNNYLWHSGIAGYLMSGVSFIISGLFIFKAARLITKSNLAGIFSIIIFSFNINILYLQTTAMSESIFIASLSAYIYFMLSWLHTNEKLPLIYAALSISLMTLIRYEGLAILIPSILLIFILSFLKDRDRKVAEGDTIIYATLACLGFLLWTLYLTIIFGDPLYWKNFYAGAQVASDGSATYSQAKPFMAAVWQYFTSFVWMMGIIPTILSIIAIPIILIVCIKRKSWDFLVLFLPLAIYLFMVLTLKRNTPIVQPFLNISTLLSGDTSLGTGFNIRYGLLLLPWVAIMCSYLLVWKNKYIRPLIFIFLCLLLSVQIYTYFKPEYTVIYKIPARINPKPFANSVNWLKANYDGGKILISAGSQEDQMFAMGFDYKTFIHEGAGKYWKESLDNPSRYAKWVVIDYGHDADNLAKKMSRKDILEREYDVVYTEKQLKIFKKITAPYYEIK